MLAGGPLTDDRGFPNGDLDVNALVMRNIGDGLTENPSDAQPSGRASCPSCTSPTTSAAGHPERNGHQGHPGRGSA